MAATGGALNDFARLPTRQKVLIFVVIGILLGGLYWQFVYKKLDANLAAAEAANTAKANENKRLAGEIPKFEKLKERVKELETKVAENQKALPTEAEVPAFFETLERKVTESGVEINKWKKLKEDPIETFVKVPVEIEINGTFMQIKRFFASLVQRDVSPVVPVDGQPEDRERERVVSIENLSLTNPVVRNREINLTAKFVAVTFRQEDKAAAPAAKKPAAAPAAKPAAPAAPASTPQGAKANTEKALDKGDTVNRNATGVDEAKTPNAEKLKGGI